VTPLYLYKVTKLLGAKKHRRYYTSTTRTNSYRCRRPLWSIV